MITTVAWFLQDTFISTVATAFFSDLGIPVAVVVAFPETFLADQTPFVEETIEASETLNYMKKYWSLWQKPLCCRCWFPFSSPWRAGGPSGWQLCCHCWRGFWRAAEDPWGDGWMLNESIRCLGEAWTWALRFPRERCSEGSFVVNWRET